MGLYLKSVAIEPQSPCHTQPKKGDSAEKEIPAFDLKRNKKIFKRSSAFKTKEKSCIDEISPY